MQACQPLLHLATQWLRHMKWKSLHGRRLSARLLPNAIPECSNLFSHLLLRPASAVISCFVAVDQRHLLPRIVRAYHSRDGLTNSLGGVSIGESYSKAMPLSLAMRSIQVLLWCGQPKAQAELANSPAVPINPLQH